MDDIISHQRNANQNYMRYHFTPIMVAMIKKKKSQVRTSVGENVEKLEHS